MADQSERQTRRVDIPDNADSAVTLRVTTGSLAEELPWVIEFRIVGTADTLQIQVRESMIIGRSDPQGSVYPDVDLAPFRAHHSGVSRQHAAIIAQDNRIKVKDLGSVNGTRLNGNLLQPHQEYRLRHSDELKIGQIKLQVRFAVVPTIDATPSNRNANHAAIPVLGSGQRVLVVEDDADVGKVFSIALEHAGFKVTVMDTAVSALGYISHQLPDVIVLDLMLPDMNGLELVRYLRKQEGAQHIPVIICSGATGGFHMNRARDEGADVCLSKPVSVDDLLRAVSGMIRPVDAAAS